MAVIIPFPPCSAGTAAAEWPQRARFQPEVRAALLGMDYALPGVKVQFCTEDQDYEWAIVGPVLQATTWFMVHPVLTGGLALRDDRMRLVGRYKTGATLRAALEPLAKSRVPLCI